ncbi:hypothetical protein PAERUG_P48_London_17_VIM_2_01_13_00844 [Pseudomonas aeruginosa]|nr:hypothetical protein PAERUG_P48_London_17_VIM_2_01_13_00844 [Pseudomonas aeruginosa]
MSHWLILPILLPLFAGSLLLLSCSPCLPAACCCCRWPSAGSAACRCSRRWR